jgi:perosamine synthetase
MDAICELARMYGLTVIEDATESLGSRYKDRKAGALADVACLSFNANKVVTTGAGGMLLTGNEAWADRVRHLCAQAKTDPVEYVHDQVGYNYRLTNIQAAVGVAQMEKLAGFIEAKRAHARAYARLLCSLAGIRLPRQAPWAYWNCWLYTIFVDRTRFGICSRGLMKRLCDSRVQTRPLWHPVHTLPPYRGCEAFRVEVADRLYEQALSLPSSVGLTAEHLRAVASLIRKACPRAG